jgi:hypothetical protein
MPDEKETEQTIPDMSQLEIEDVSSIVLGVPPEGEEIVIYEDGDDKETD